MNQATNDTWSKHVGAAKVTWERLTTEELVASKGHEATLSNLIKEHYTITQEAAAKQVRAFFEKRKNQDQPRRPPMP